MPADVADGEGWMGGCCCWSGLPRWIVCLLIMLLDGAAACVLPAIVLH